MAKFTHALNQLLRMEMALSMAYHPQMDGQTERLNQELEQYLWLYVNHMQTNWVDWLPITEFTYNNVSTWRPVSHPSSSSMAAICSSLRHPGKA
jgi:hypothetical protein